MSTRYPFKIRLRDINEKYIGQVTEYLSCNFHPRWNGVGTWSIKLAGNSAGALGFLPGCGISVVLPDGTLFSGHATSFLDEWDEESNSGQGTITISGVEDKAILGYRVVLPDYASDYTLQTAAANYTMTGPVESQIKQVVQKQLGTLALAARRLTGFQVAADGAGGSVITTSARYDNLLDFVQRIATPYGYGFNLISVPGGWNFFTQVAVDVSNKVIFSRQNANLLGYTFQQAAPTTTRAVVGGAGAGIARNIKIYDQAGGAVDPKWGWLVEGFVDRRDTNLSSDLAQAGAEALAAGAQTQALTISVRDTPNIAIGKDYQLGSKVSVIVRGVTYTDIVTEMDYNSTPNQLRIKPTIGGADAVYGKALDIYKVVKSISARVALIERRY